MQMKKLYILLAVYITLHLLLVNTPDTHTFDEFYYVPAATSVIEGGDELRPEHPPLVPLIIAGGISLFGDNPLGWRAFSIIFGGLTILVLYFLVKDVSKDERLAFAVAFIIVFQNLFFAFSQLALLDIYLLFFITLSIFLFLKNRFILSAFALALAATCKLSAAFAVPIFPAILMYHDLIGQAEGRNWRSIRWGRLALWFTVLATSFLACLYIFDQLYSGLHFQGLYEIFSFGVGNSIHGEIVGKEMYIDPLSHLRHMLGHHVGGGWPPTDEPKPWLWFNSPYSYYLIGYSYYAVEVLEKYNAAFMGLVFVSMPLAVYRAAKRGDECSFLAAVWFIFTVFMWIPIYFIYPRPLYLFYILPAIPAICLANVNFFRGTPYLEYYLMVVAGYFMLFQYPIRAIGQAI
jgi:4-amino-4-deoxy-L-arabinose transferase-like glycosyltransferase